ncbi:hypothetical protein AAG906_025089 [Vitis piasezkii]
MGMDAEIQGQNLLNSISTGSDGRRLLALKFVESVILLYTPDPNGSSDPPSNQPSEGNCLPFCSSLWNLIYLGRGGHPVLNVGDLSIQASQSLGLLLDQLRFPTVKSISNSMIIVLINSLSVIARKRPSFYGRILPVLLGLDPSSSVIEGVHISGAHHTLRNAFLSCLKCTHPVLQCQKTKHALWICELCLKESHSRDMVCVGSVGVDACFPV